MGNTGLDRVKTAFQHVQTDHPPKAELWLGADILHRACFEDTLDGRLRLVTQLKQDMICLPTAHEPYFNKALGYRYFPVAAIQEVLETADLFVMIIIDGPFQRLAEKVGLMKIFSGWMREREDVLRAYENERAHVESLLGRCLEHSVHGVVIADDLAGDQSTFLDPLDIQRFFLLFTIRQCQESMRPMPLPCFIPAATFPTSFRNSSPTGSTAWQRFKVEQTILCR
jgi:hypothetical protein